MSSNILFCTNQKSMYFKGKAWNSDILEGRTSRSLLKKVLNQLIMKKVAVCVEKQAIKHLSGPFDEHMQRWILCIKRWKSVVKVCLLLSAFCWGTELSNGFIIEALNQVNQTSYPQKIKDHKVPPFQGAFRWLKVLVQPVVASFYTYCYVSVHKACCVSFSSLPVCGSSCVRRHSRPEFSVKMRTMRLKESLHLKTAADSAVPDLWTLSLCSDFIKTERSKGNSKSQRSSLIFSQDI